jgi:hypothetical protein
MTRAPIGSERHGFETVQCFSLRSVLMRGLKHRATCRPIQ